jgi:hypothetical protein
MNPVIIIGAPRSGTNILRDTLSSIGNVGTWDCDEIPYIWLYGNKKYSTDILTPNHTTSNVKQYIRNQFSKLGEELQVENVLEKTCANSLRVDFVDSIFPEAKYIYIKRNGLDVTYSIMQRWNASFSLAYTLKKFKYVPKSDIPFYGIEFFKNRYHKIKNKDRLKFWGPRFANADKLSGLTVEEISAKQWVACVEESNKSFNKIDPKRVYSLTYEDFATNPKQQIKNMAMFLEITLDEKMVFPTIRSSSIGKGTNMLTSSQLKMINPIIKKTMIDNQYPCL